MLGIDAVLLFIFVFKFIPLFYARVSVYLYVLKDNYLVFFIIPLLLVGCYLMAGFIRSLRRTPFIRIGIIVFIAVFMIGSLLGLQILVRKQTKPFLFIHDGAVQTEEAVAALASGQNPYGFDYSKTTFGAFPDYFSNATRPNPALHHYVYPPLPVVVGVPFAWLSRVAVGWFDVRFMYLISFIALIAAAALLCSDREKRIVVLILMIFNPYFIQFFIAGFNDVFFLGFIAIAAMLLRFRKVMLAAIAVGLSVASKQPAALLVPFFFAYVFAATQERDRLRYTLKIAAVTAITAAAIILPFFAWSPSRFIDDTLRFATGAAAASYPISGFGLGQLLVSSGTVPSMWSGYPFWLWQLVLGVPALVALVAWQLKSNSIGRMLAGYAAFSFLMLFVSRYFNDSHLAMLSVVAIMAYAAPWNLRDVDESHA